jgi:hypothetical protein
MSPHQKNKDEILFPKDKQTLLLYSLYLAVCSVSFFIAINQLWTTYQGYIWSYTTKYVLNSLAVGLVILIASGLLFMGCYQMAKGNRFPKLLGAIGCILIIVYPGYVYLTDLYVAYAFFYTFLLWIPALVVLLIAFYIWYTQK